MTTTTDTTQTRIIAIKQESERILANDPTHEGALKKLGYSQWILGDFEAVVATATRILELNPADADWLYSRAMAQLAQRELEAATSDLQKALALSRDPRLTETILDAIRTIREVNGPRPMPTHAVVEIESEAA